MIRLVVVLVAAIAALSMSNIAGAQSSSDPRVAAASEARDAYWRALDSQDLANAYAMLTPGMQAMGSQDRFSSDTLLTLQQMGSVIERRALRTTVYDNPPSAPEPGAYVAFDFVGRFERADRNCGYIILHQSVQGGPFRVTRTDQTFLPNDQANGSGQPPDELWAQMATSFCPGWQRSWAIQPPV